MNDDIQILDKKINIFNQNYNRYKQQNSINEVELKECLCDVLSWMEICIKKIQNLNNIEIEMIRAIKYANNMKKHSISIYNYTLNSLGLYPSKHLYPSKNLYPSRFNILWNCLPLDAKGFKNEYNSYNKYLKGNEVYKTINDINIIIKNHYII